jgi:ankyrin repeat protein
VDRAKAGDCRAVRLLLAAGVRPDGEHGVLALRESILNRWHEVFCGLLSAGTDPNGNEANGSTPVMMAALVGDAAVVKALLRAGVDINRQDISGHTALIMAAGSHCADCVDFLLASGANLDLRDNEGDTALTLAAQLDETEIVSMLKNKGAR